MVKLTRAEIRSLATDDTIYSRGLRYYQNKAIKNIGRTPGREHYHAVVQGKNDYTVDVEFGKDGNVSYHCNCPASIKYAGACKHVIAVLLFIEDYKERSAQNAGLSPEQKKIRQIIDYFDKMEFLPEHGETFHLRTTLRIPKAFRKDGDEKAIFTFQAGSSKLYKIQNLRKFLVDYRDGENIQLGKSFRYFAGESHFDKDAKGLLDLLLSIEDVQEMAGTTGLSIFNRAEMYLDETMMIRVLKQIRGSFGFAMGDEEVRDVVFLTRKPEINLYLNQSEEEDAITLSWDEERIRPLDERGGLFCYGDAIYQPDKQFARHFLPFYRSMAEDGDGTLVFSGEEKIRFLQSVLPRIHETFSMTIPKALQKYYITDDVQIQMYFDYQNNNIRVELITVYGEYSFNPFRELPSGKAIIVRQTSKESAAVEELESLGFMREEGYFYLRDEQLIYEFLKMDLTALQESYSLFYSDAFKNIRITQPKLAKTSVHVQSENNLLEVDFEFQEISDEELADLFRSLTVRKKYFRLKNGSFLDLTGGDVDKLTGLLDRIGDSGSHIEDGKFLTSLDYAFYLNQAIEGGAYNIEQDPSFRELMDEIQNPKVEDVKVPAEIRADLRDYQKIGFQWMRSLAKYRLSGILADDMGLGKTLQSIAYIQNLVNQKPDAVSLVVCPSSLVYNWADEIENFSPGLTSTMILGTPAERKERIQNCQDYNIVLVSYPILRRDIELIRQIPFDTVFLDEAQFIKNPNSQNARAVKSLHGEHRFALTGTPIENNLSELWSIFDFLMPGYLYSHARFVASYEKPIMRMDDTDALTQLNFHIKPFILRRMKKDVLKELPEKTEQKIVSDMTDEQKEIYLAYLANMKQEIGSEIEKKGFDGSRMMILASLTRLRQICCHPATFLDHYTGGSGKMILLMHVLKNSIANGHRVLIFSQFTSMLQLIETEIRQVGYSYFYLDGNTPLVQRGEDVKRFNEGEGSIYLISLKAGGTGLNLTGADMVIHFDPWWNPAVEEQATDRVYRIGQTNNVTVLKLITKGTIEEKIYKLQEKKKDLADSVIQAGELFINKLTADEIKALFDL